VVEMKIICTIFSSSRSREGDNLHNSIPAMTGVEKKIICTIQFQQKQRRR
jgi:hypothetical protein